MCVCAKIQFWWLACLFLKTCRQLCYTIMLQYTRMHIHIYVYEFEHHGNKTTNTSIYTHIAICLQILMNRISLRWRDVLSSEYLYWFFHQVACNTFVEIWAESKRADTHGAIKAKFECEMWVYVSNSHEFFAALVLCLFMCLYMCRHTRSPTFYLDATTIEDLWLFIWTGTPSQHTRTHTTPQQSHLAAVNFLSLL